MKKGRRLCGLLVLLCVFLTACSAAAETKSDRSHVVL